jgi:hypothetical protein
MKRGRKQARKERTEETKEARKGGSEEGKK